MFVGHYSVSFILKSKKPETPFWIFLIAVQFVDVLFMLFLLLGIEKMNLTEGHTAYNDFELYFMPYTHSLLAHIIWSGLAYFIVRYVVLSKMNTGAAIKEGIALLAAIGVASHFVLDLIVHTQDLPLWTDNSPKIGLGLWNNLPLAMAAELGLLIAGMAYYFKNSRPGEGTMGIYGMWIFAAFLVITAISTPFLPTPESVTEFALQGFFGYVFIAVLGNWAARTRIHDLIMY